MQTNHWLDCEALSKDMLAVISCWLCGRMLPFIWKILCSSLPLFIWNIPPSRLATWFSFPWLGCTYRVARPKIEDVLLWINGVYPMNLTFYLRSLFCLLISFFWRYEVVSLYYLSVSSMPTTFILLLEATGISCRYKMTNAYNVEGCLCCEKRDRRDRGWHLGSAE